MRAWRALCVALVLLPDPARAQEERAESVVTVLSYNVHGLFRLAARDDPRDRSPTIGWLANRYDVVLLQEDFEYHDEIRDQMRGTVGFRGNGMGLDPRRVTAKLLTAPFQILVPHFSPPYGAGISTFVHSELAVLDDFDRKPYGVCHGWFGANGDCWAAKGYLRVGIRTPAGARLDVYNTHLEAGPTPESVETRRRQLDILASAIETLSAERAIIVGGDFNSAFNRPGDREAIMEFRTRLNLQDSGAGPEIPFWRERDYILHRNGGETTLEVEQMGEATEFVNKDVALSDHPALYARFRIRAEPGSGAEEP